MALSSGKPGVDLPSSGPVNSHRTSVCSGERKVFENWNERLLTYKQTAKYLGISEVYLRRLKAAGRIKSVPVGFGARPGVRFDIFDLNKWIEERKF